MKNIHAFTETNVAPPGYISINEEVDRLSVSVRTRGGQVPSIIEMNRDQLEAMARDVLTYLGVDHMPVKVHAEAAASAKSEKEKA